MGHYSFRILKRVATGGREPRDFWQHLEACDRCHAGLDLARAARWAQSEGSSQKTNAADHLTLQEMLQLVEGALSKRRRRAAIAHLAHCEPCRIQVAGFSQAGEALDAGSAVQATTAGVARQARELWRQATGQQAGRPAVPCISAKNPMTICLLADDSQSMAGDAALAATEAIRDFVALLQASCGSRGSCFRLLVVKFGDFPTVLCDDAPILDVDPQQIQLSGDSGGTDIAGVLELAGARLCPAAMPTASVPPLLLLYSDGHATGPDPAPVAAQIKALTFPGGQSPLLVTCGFGEADEGLLQRLATSPDHYQRLASPMALRRFLALVGSSMTSVTTEGRSTATVWRDIGRALAYAA